jgi:hypothetical protein
MRMSIRRIAVLALVASFSIFRGISLWAVEGQAAQPTADVQAIVIPMDTRGEAFRQVVADVVKYGLERRGLEIAFIKDPSVARAGLNDKDLVSKAVGARASIALICRYVLAGPDISVSLQWFEAKTGVLTASAQKVGQGDLQFDTLVLQAIDDLLSQVGDRVSELAAKRASLAKDTRPADTPPEDSSSNSPAAEKAAAAQPPKAAALPQVSPPAGSGLLFSSGFATFLPIGASASYFTVGYRPSVLGSYLFSTSDARIGIGLYGLMDYFRAQGAVEASNNFFIPLGLDLRYELDLRAPLIPFIHLTGGPALIVMATQIHGSYLKILPYAALGLGVELLVLPGLSIGLGVDYEVYFEMPYMIMGVSPSLGVTVRP